MAELEVLVRKYYGYIADLEGSGVEALDLLFVRDKIQRILDQSKPDAPISSALYGRIHELDDLLWRERHTFLTVIGEKELQHARDEQRSPRSHWWWYLDELQLPPEKEAKWEQELALAKAFAPAG